MPAREVSVEVPGGRLHGTLLAPRGVSRYDVALLIPGSGPGDRNGNGPGSRNNALELLAEGLLERGIASLRFDKRGIGASAKALAHERDLSIEVCAADAGAWLKFLAARPAVDTRFVIGHSEGALVGALAAQQADTGGFISLAGMGAFPADTLRRQLAESSLTPSRREEAMSIVERLSAGEQVEYVPVELGPLFRPGVQPYLLSWFRYDPAEEIAKLRVPVLIVQGTSDIQIGVADAQRLANAKPDAELRVIEGMNHVLKAAPLSREENIATYDDPELPLSDGLIESVAAFIGRLSRLGDRGG